MRVIKFYFKFLLLSIVFYCTKSNDVKQQKNFSENEIDSNSKSPSNEKDDKEFQLFLKIFSDNVKNENNDLVEFMNFPFYTSQQSDINNLSLPSDSISLKEFNQFKNLIFNEDVIRLLPSFGQDNLSEIDNNTADSYYQSLKKLTDSNSKMYEVYFQYPEKNTQSENYFAFVFGKVNAHFKVLSTYSKWPIK